MLAVSERTMDRWEAASRLPPSFRLGHHSHSPLFPETQGIKRWRLTDILASLPQLEGQGISNERLWPPLA